ncbi:MAG: formylglycine-generating enzyme family protein, partial [Verrucomicrobia bacterium]|nr:formylglycine-generating enzyme family protein [Verrucomicrobiota bacterium]
MKKTFTFILTTLALAGMTAQAEIPSLNYEINGNELIINYTGTLLQSADAIIWTEVTSASSPYKIALGNKKQFFCAKGESGGENITIPLSDTVNLDMIWINPGTFMMGSPEDELGRSSDETQHQVTLTKGYWLGKYEVTQSQYEAVMGSNPSGFKGADRPVEKVSWDNAMRFCAKLNAQEKAAGRLPEGYEYTLPTEAQWEYACRADTTTALNNGKNLTNYRECSEIDEVGWYEWNSDKQTHSVGLKKPNAWGLYDMHGNVFEWCLDWYGDYPSTAVANPTGPTS